MSSFRGVGTPSALFSPSSDNIKISPEQKFFIFREMDLSGSNIKKIVIFSKKSFSYISENGHPTKKIPYILGNRNLQARKIKKTLLKSSLSFRK